MSLQLLYIVELGPAQNIHELSILSNQQKKDDKVMEATEIYIYIRLNWSASATRHRQTRTYNQHMINTLYIHYPSVVIARMDSSQSNITIKTKSIESDKDEQYLVLCKGNNAPTLLRNAQKCSFDVQEAWDCLNTTLTTVNKCRFFN